MDNSPLVSVIIPCYNGGTHLQLAVDSLRKQTYSNYEVIIVDDGSTDPSTLEYLQQLSGWATVIHQANAGPCVARHNGIMRSTGQYLFFLDSDNMVRDTYISKGVAAMEQDSTIGVVYSDFKYCGAADHVRRNGSFDIQKLVIINPIDICSVVRRSAYDDVGGFDMYLSRLGLEDWEIWFTFYERGWKFHYLPEPLFDYRVHEISRTQTVANKNLDVIVPYIHRKHIHTIIKCYTELYYERNQLKTSLNTRIGDALLTPYRLLKGLWKK
ncbi:MAG: glycosyltransferase [Bacteroidetes bacterium]|nr:glycosyltransferase [Bacteroidota bacterium]